VSDIANDLDAIATRAGAEGRRAAEAGQSVADRAARQELDDRTLITRTVTTVFFVAVPGSLVLLLILSVISSASAKDAILAVTDILKSVLLPIVTLVLGYYFGRGRG
jgi:hypothetical protein